MVERQQMQHLSLQNHDMPVHKFIPLEKLDFIQPNQVRILYYKNPSLFYVYLRQKINTHAQFQVELQRAMQNYQLVPSPTPQYQRYEPVVAQDNHSVWHRATILNFNPNSTEICVYFVDFGQQENISVTNIRPLPHEFIRQPAFAIPCRLYDICPRNGNQQSTWKSDDPVHEEFNGLIANISKCKVCEVQEQICYDVQIEIPEVGDLGTFLFEKNLVSRITMQTSQSQQSFGRIPPGFTGLSSSIQQPQRLTPQNDYYTNSNSTVQQPPTRLIQKPIVQQSPSAPTSTDSLSDIHTLPPQDGNYIITQVYSAVEFYGHSQVREKELIALHKYLEEMYNNNVNDQSISVHLLMEGTSCVVQQGDKYHRVVIKHRESESRVLVKLVDRGDELLVDTSELLQLEKKCLTIPAFAQPFRLHNYDESQSTANITRKLKRLILNQRVQIIQHLPMINGFYPVEVKLSDNQLVNQILLSNDNIPIIPPAARPIETQTPKVQQDGNIQRTNDDLPAPQKLLTAGPSGRAQPGRFTANPPVVNEQPSRFARPQQQDEQPSRVINSNQQQSSEQNRPYSRGFTNDEQQGGSNRSGGFADRGLANDGGNRGGGFSDRGSTDDGNNRGGGFADRGLTDDGGNRGGGFADRGSSNDEQRNGNNRTVGFSDRGGRGGYTDRNFNRNNDENENGGQRSTGFNNRGGGGGGGFADRGNRGGFSDRNNYENKNENGEQRSGGFNNRGGFTDRGGYGGRGGATDRGGFTDRGGYGGRGGSTDRGGFAERGARGGGGFQDRNGGNRNNYDDDQNENGGAQRSQGFGSRGGFNGDRGGRTGFRDRGDDRDGGGDNGRRGGFGDRGGQRGGRGSRGSGRGGFGDRNNNGFQPNTDNNDPPATFSGWPNAKPKPFESGDHFIENEIPKESFQFVISHIETPNDFFIQSYSKDNELSELTETLQREYKDAPELNLNSIKSNQACLAKSDDDCWYRASILTTNSSKTNVRFIDFGNTTDVTAKLVRHLAQKFCLRPPYAYRCELRNVEANENISMNDIIDKCAGDKRFNGKIEKKISDGKYLLQSENFEKLMMEINAIKPKSQINLKSLIVYIDHDKHRFYIQTDDQTMDKIDNEVHTTSELSSDEIQVKSMVISTFEGAPYRAIIEEDLDENVKVYFIDFGNRNICPKTSLKKCHEQLKEYPPQAKCCELYDVALNDLDQAFEQLDKYLESDNTEICIVNQNDDVCNVRLYVDGECFNESIRNGKNEANSDMDDESSSTITTTTTVKEQERPTSATGKRNNEEILSPVGNSLTTSMNTKRQKSESETEVNPIKYHEGVLTHIDKNKPIVYLQSSPDSDPIIEQINELIQVIVEKNKHNSSYDTGDHVIAQFTDDNHYRARIESYSTSSQNYTVYFLDYGNTDENVPVDHLYSYSDELKQIEPQTHNYTVENQTTETWPNHVRPLIERKLNEIIEYYFTDETKSIIHIKFDNENTQPQTLTGNISGTTKDCFYIHILPTADTNICEMDELIQLHAKEHNTSNQWEIHDLCIVFDNKQREHFRGKILSKNNEKYDVQCIDYGNIISDVTNDELYLLTDDELLKQPPLARQCRLYGVDDDQQIKAIEEVIKNINPTERVTITVENDQNDRCMFVMLFRENHEIVNDRYRFNNDNQQETDINKENAMLLNSSDSAIAADNDTSNDEIQLPTNDQQLTSPIGIPQAESTHQYGDTTNATISNSSPSSMTVNGTIDFGENDLSTANTTMKDETENEDLPLN